MRNKIIKKSEDNSITMSFDTKNHQIIIEGNGKPFITDDIKIANKVFEDRIKNKKNKLKN